MAQLLVCSVPNPGHFNPMLTLSRHLAAAGHTILFYTAETFQSKVEARVQIRQLNRQGELRLSPTGRLFP
jgi:UDP:flavonoid glycosyltransferase YjiC (YdhE family)